MEHLLGIPTDFWGKFLKLHSSESDTQTLEPELDVKTTASRHHFGTPTMRNDTMSRKERKFFATPPYSAKRK